MKLCRLSRLSSLTLVLGLACLSAASGCSSSSDDKAKFIGAWTFTSGSLNGTCLGQTLAQNLAGGALTIEKGTTSDLLVTFNSCMLSFKASGTTATADPINQTCSFDVPSFGRVTVTITSWTLVESSGPMLTSSTMGMALANCPVTATGTAVPGSPDASTGG